MLRRSGISLMKIKILLAYGLVLMYSAVRSRAQLTAAVNCDPIPALKAVAIYTFEGRKVSNIKIDGVHGYKACASVLFCSLFTNIKNNQYWLAERVRLVTISINKLKS
ncbi:hypothetical protein J2T02_003493 [Chitinophaga terrae (ex Kim and Jung 2007)]|uniref:hypothetical protein n=1 Tax=Chitinophaga terrae (ex Kim and Jung 2007) TaxID=408074 RepID=UPI0027807AC0|nr:hypothetical protein [Chitinophaga terrae (ex Kim and Jung 2007)]MDQ0108360.1 hypothetical protein [Chitinophaga terrae (ex Kim and Jung 2007)]